MPLLQAEEDRDQARRYFADKAREKELLGTDAKIYNSDRYVYLYICIWMMSIGQQGIANHDSFEYSFVRPTFTYTPSKVTQ